MENKTHSSIPGNGPQIEKKQTDLKAERHKELMKREVSESGVISWGDNVQKQLALAEAFLSSGMLPKQYKTAAQVITAKQFASELGLDSTLVSLRQIAVINGTPSLFGDLPLAVVRKSGELEDYEQFLFDKEYNKICFDNKNLHNSPFGALVKAKRNGKWHESYFTVEMAKQAGLSNRDVWKNYPERMLTYRARAALIKDVFSDLLNGVNIGEYDQNELKTNDSGVYVDDQDNYIDQDMSPEKEKLIKSICDCTDILQNEYKVNDAKILQMIADKTGTDDLNIANENQLSVLESHLKQTIKLFENMKKGKENEKA